MDNSDPVKNNPILPNVDPLEPANPLPADSPPAPQLQDAPPQMPQVTSTVVIPEKKDKLPLWFYILFAIVAIVFFTVTFLLVRTLLEKSNAPVSRESSNQTLNQPSPTTNELPTVEPTPVDDYLNSLNVVSESDKTVDIESDLKATDTAPLKSEYSQLEKENGLVQQ